MLAFSPRPHAILLHRLRNTHTHDFPPPQTNDLKTTKQQIPCPSILDGPATVSLSVVIPAYNEEGRLPSTLDEILPYLAKRHQLGRHPGALDPPFTWEVIVVDDGSRDATARVALDYARRHPFAPFAPSASPSSPSPSSPSGGCVRVLRLTRNRGKGMAVREGALATRGALVLFCDADGATRFRDVALLEDALDACCAASFGGRAGSAAGAVRAAMAAAAEGGGAGAQGGKKAAAIAAAATAAAATLPADPRGPVGAALGSRAHLQAAAVRQRAPLRNALMHGFHLAVRLAAGEGVVAPPAAAEAGGGGGKKTAGAAGCGPQQGGKAAIRDTQCGFKLATRRAAARLFLNQRLQRWCFDVELALLARRLGVPLREVGVCWTEMPGSKIRPTSVLHMAWELAVLRLAYGAGGGARGGGGGALRSSLLGLGGPAWCVRGEADARPRAGGGGDGEGRHGGGGGGGKDE